MPRRTSIVGGQIGLALLCTLIPGLACGISADFAGFKGEPPFTCIAS